MGTADASPRTGQRCPICGNAGWINRQDRDECTHCRLIVRVDADLKLVAGEIERQLAAGVVALKSDPAADWTLDWAGLRNVAWHYGYVVTPRDEQASSALASVSPARSKPHAISLAIMTREADVAATIDLLHTLGKRFARAFVIVDGSRDAASSIMAAVLETVAIAHPLAGDFAAQRNRLQTLASTGWVLQLDTDERPDARLLDSLGWLTAEADREGLRSLGLARRNIVDGKQSALYPDIQYRLNRAEIRFAGAVHERPVTKFEETSLALAGALDHYLDDNRVRRRTRLYETMSAGAGRPEDEALLLEPFDKIAVR